MFQIDPGWFQIDPWLVAIVAIGIAAFLAVAIIWGIRAHRRQASAGREELMGKTAEVLIALEPKGVVLIEGERWTAISEKGRVKPGEEVIITKVDGLKLWVTKKE
ncbi:MAG: serine protease [Dehalococcoidales bacterium]|nr:serine protease [Dehalococcoidales bacterium]